MMDLPLSLLLQERRQSPVPAPGHRLFRLFLQASRLLPLTYQDFRKPPIPGHQIQKIQNYLRKSPVHQRCYLQRILLL